MTQVQTVKFSLNEIINPHLRQFSRVGRKFTKVNKLTYFQYFEFRKA
jgi:hypothetical protein